MNAHLDLDAELRVWMADGPTTMRDDVVEAALEQSRRTRQHGSPRGPWRFLAMSTTSLTRDRRPTAPILAAAALLILAAAIGAFVVLRPDVGVGDDGPSSSRTFGASDVTAAVDAPGALDGLVRGEVPPGYALYESESAAEAVHITLATSVITVGDNLADEERRAELMGRIYTGLESARVRFYDAAGADGEAMPVTESGGASYTVLAATYTDADAASAAFGAYVEAYETWEFSGSEAWDHADESAAFAYSTMDRTHARCHVLSSVEPCGTGLRVWRHNNIVVTLIQEGEGDVTPEAVVAAVDAELR